MKKEQMELKEVIKAAILEAFAEMYGVATMAEGDETGSGSETPTNPGDKGDEGSSNTGGSNTGDNNSGNTGNTGNTGGNTKPSGPIEPEPMVGVGGFSLRKS